MMRDAVAYVQAAGKAAMIRAQNLLAVALIGSGCWTSQPPESAPPIQVTRPNDAPPATCVEAGEQLHVSACRRDDDLAWSLTNRGEVTLWVFVAPPIAGRMAKEHALAIDVDGDVVLGKKLIRKEVGDHPYLVGAIALAAGESSDGVVPLGPPQDNLVRLNAQPLRWFTVSLEVGYAEKAPTDRASKDGEFHLVAPFRIERQQLVKTPPIPWR